MRKYYRMRVTVERLRLWILLAASLLIAVLAGFFLWGGLKYRRVVRNLPHRLGVNIEQTASGFTYSQSSHGHTLFTIHASKLMSFKNEVAELHDVSITLYGPAGSQRTDHIYGAEFEYNRKTGIASSAGKVEIDLESPSQNGQAKPQQAIHVETSQLTYDSKSGLAQTSQYTEFSMPQGAGHATGATYNSKTGLLVLEKQVFLQTQPQHTGSGATIHAAHLSFLRESNQAKLLAPVMQYPQGTATAAQALVSFRPNGSADHLTARGNVRMTTAGGATFNSQLAKMTLSQKSQPLTADLSGGVTYESHAPHRNMQGSAQTAHLLFAAQPGHPDDSLLRHAQFDQSVHFVERLTGLPAVPNEVITRELQGTQAEVAFAPAPGGAKSLPQTITVQQNAVATLRTSQAHQPPQRTTVRADTLVATMTNGSVLHSVTGTGNAEISSTGKNGVTNTTQSDVIHLSFAPPQKSSGRKITKQPSAVAQLVSAVEDGHVIMRQTTAKHAGAAQLPVTAWAHHADYTASDETVRLRGNPRLQQGNVLELSADTIDYQRRNGNALADGSVKATYRQPAGSVGVSASQPLPQLGGKGATHVVAARARFSATQGDAWFYGASGRAARLWQDGNSVSAPVIELRRKPQELRAYGSGKDTVNTAFAAVVGAKAPSGMVRVTSDALTYSGKSHLGVFHGNVMAVDAFGTMRAAAISMRITPARDHHPSQLEEMIATGGVLLTQPGRRAVGTKLVYTAKDERYVLTGRPHALPYIVDRVHGKTTGAALIFNNRNDSVEVNGGEGSAVTETSIPH